MNINKKMCKVKDLQHKFQLVYPYYINYIYQHRCLHGGRYCLFGKIVIFSFFYCRAGSRLHRGYDIVCAVGASVYAPFPARVLDVSIPYGRTSSHWGAVYNTGVFMEGTGSWTGKTFISKSFVQTAKNA